MTEQIDDFVKLGDINLEYIQPSYNVRIYVLTCEQGMRIEASDSETIDTIINSLQYAKNRERLLGIKQDSPVSFVAKINPLYPIQEIAESIATSLQLRGLTCDRKILPCTCDRDKIPSVRNFMDK